MSGHSRYFFGTFEICSSSETGGDVAAFCLNLDFRNSEFRDDLEDCESLRVVAGSRDVAGLRVVTGGSFEIESSSNVLESQSI